jgi:NADH:ubiquinone oxidoreductase subunit K
MPRIYIGCIRMYMNVVTVRTKDELATARKSGVEQIVVQGELADKVKRGKKIAFASSITLAALGAALVATPMTGGLSFFAAAPVAALTGLEIAAIIAAASIGLALIIALFKDYEEISYESGKLVLKKKSS